MGRLWISSRGSVHFQEGQAKSCQSPGQKALMQAEHPHSGPFRQLAGCRGRVEGQPQRPGHSLRPSSDPRTQRHTWSSFRGELGHPWLLPGGGRALSSLAVHGVKEGCIPEPQRLPARQDTLRFCPGRVRSPQEVQLPSVSTACQAVLRSGEMKSVLSTAAPWDSWPDSLRRDMVQRPDTHRRGRKRRVGPLDLGLSSSSTGHLSIP
jgi:hypothetical protein